jgi:DNA-binding transcriptional LysR family regulator
METNRILQFRAIVETGNLRKAAELIGISHSGLSKSMKALESELGYALFQASGRGIITSDDGHLFYERSQAFLAAYETLLGTKAGVTTQALRIGSLGFCCINFK